MQAQEGKVVSLSYKTASTSCIANYTVKGCLGLSLPYVFDFVLFFSSHSWTMVSWCVCVCVCLCRAERLPAFSLEVNPLSKSFKVKMDVAEYPVCTRWCYLNWPGCFGNGSIPVPTTAPHSQPVDLRFPFLLPCLCVEVAPLLENFTPAGLPGRLSGVSLSLSRLFTVSATLVGKECVHFSMVL